MIATGGDPPPRDVPLARPRFEAVDLLRGIIMVVMALDHARDFFGFPGDDPTDLARAGAALFLTRWITSFCAPVFFLLTGTGARLSLSRKTRGGLSRFLLTRGAWLILFELTAMRVVGYQWNADYRVTMLLVLWALGGSMIALSALVWLPAPAILAFGLALIAGHDLFDGVANASPGWALLHAPGFVYRGDEHVVFVAYPLVPWIGVTAVGYALGAVYGWEGPRRRALLVRVGLSATAAFLVVRGLDLYGDPSPWSPQGTVARTALSFLRTTKYPPSLSFLLMTLGPAIPPARRHRPRGAEVAPAAARVRTRATLLLRAPLLHDSRARGGRRPRADGIGARDVRIARSGALPVHRSTGVGLSPARRDGRVGGRRRGDVRAVPVVRRVEAAATGRVAQLLLEPSAQPSVRGARDLHGRPPGSAPRVRQLDAPRPLSARGAWATPRSRAEHVGARAWPAVC